MSNKTPNQHEQPKQNCVVAYGLNQFNQLKNWINYNLGEKPTERSRKFSDTERSRKHSDIAKFANVSQEANASEKIVAYAQNKFTQLRNFLASHFGTKPTERL
jgi:hypothetical protein